MSRLIANKMSNQFNKQKQDENNLGVFVFCFGKIFVQNVYLF